MPSLTEPAADGGRSSSSPFVSLPEGAALLERLRSLLASSNDLERNRAFLALVDHLRPSDFKSLMEALPKLNMIYGEEEMLLLSAWAEIDPPAAVAWEEGMKMGDHQTVLKLWVQRDPQAALAWAQANPTPQGPNDRASVVRMAILQARADELLKEPLEHIFGTLLSLPDAERQRMIWLLGKPIAERGPETARQWLDTIADPELRSQAAGVIISTLGGDQIQARLELLAQFPGAVDSGELGRIYSGWAAADPGSAVAALDAMPSGEARDQAASWIVGGLIWGRPADYSRIAGLLDRYPGAVSESNIADWLSRSSNIEDAGEPLLELVSRMDNASLREQSYSRVLGNWLRQDPAAAQAWLATHEGK